MAYNVTTTLRILESHLRASGRFTTVQIGEPKDPPATGFTAALTMGNARVAELTLVDPTWVHTIMIRVYRNMLAEPEADIETECSIFIDEFMDDVIGAYTLSSEVRAVDFGGIYGGGATVDWGYGDVGGKMYRIADISLPLIVNASATFSA